MTARSEAIEQAKILQAMIALAEVDVILNNFIAAFVSKTVKKEDGMSYLFGNFNLGGTVSGRLSSSKINLQNLPSSGSKYAKAVKLCFRAPKGWVMAGADFSSLEDKISALTTKDPNKIKVYTDGYDGHCLRAFSYFKSQMPDIVDTIASINSIETKYPELRQKSKAPTFALTYQGTWHTLVNNIGIPKAEAKEIERLYHVLYEHSDNWVQNKLVQASQDGYATVAFGLRIRTPILGQTILGTSSTPYEAKAEGRTVGNALGQSWGMLNNRAAIEFRKRLLASKYKYDIIPISHIHDAQYFLLRENLAVIEWFNVNLVECMEWQDDPAIEHDDVKLGGNVEIYYPSWATKYTIPNWADQEEIARILKEPKDVK